METNPLVETTNAAWMYVVRAVENGEARKADFEKLIHEIQKATLSDIEKSLPKIDSTEDANEFEKADRMAWNACRAQILTTLHKKKELLDNV